MLGVAMPTMQVVDVVSVLHGLVAAVRAVFVGVVLVCAGEDVHVESVAFVHVIFVDVVGMPVVEVVDVLVVLDGDMPAVGSMCVGVVLEGGVRHGGSLIVHRCNYSDICIRDPCRGDGRLAGSGDLSGMLDGVTHDVCHVLVSQRVARLSAVAVSAHQPCSA